MRNNIFSDNCLMTAWQLSNDCLPDNYLTTLWPQMDDSLTTDWQLPDHCLTIAWWLYDIYLTTWRLIPAFKVDFALNDFLDIFKHILFEKYTFLKKVTCSIGSRKFCCLNAVNFLGYSFYSGSHDGTRGFLNVWSVRPSEPSGSRSAYFFLELRKLTFLNLTKKILLLLSK